MLKSERDREIGSYIMMILSTILGLAVLLVVIFYKQIATIIWQSTDYNPEAEVVED